jgi:hypothetical protein
MISFAASLHEYLTAQGIPCTTVRQSGTVLLPVTVDPAQQSQADAIAATWGQAQDQAADEAAHPERTELRQNAQAAVDAIDQYLLIADTATAAQVREQVKRLSQMMRRVIRRLVQLD